MSRTLIVEFGGFHGKDVFLNSSGTTYLTNRLRKELLSKFLNVAIQSQVIKFLVSLL